MRLLAWSSMTFACCFAHSIVDHISDGEAIFHRFFISESKLSERELTRYLNTIENNPGFVTKEVRRIFEKLPARTSSDLVTFVNEIRDGHVDLSSDPQHVISMIEARMPKLGENIDAALKMLRSTIGKMTPFSKAAFQEHWTRFFESLSAPTTLRSIFLAAFYADIIESHKTAHIAVKKEIQDLSPETDLLLKSVTNFGKGDSVQRYHPLRRFCIELWKSSCEVRQPGGKGTTFSGGSGAILKNHVRVHLVLNNPPKPSAQ